MPSINWIGKEAVVNHDKEVPFKLLKKIKAASVSDSSQNLIIHGDNLEALIVNYCTNPKPQQHTNKLQFVGMFVNQ